MSVLRLLAVAVTLVIAAIVSVLAWANWPIHLHHGVIEVTIPPKTSMQGIARMVSDSGAPIPALLFDVLARADGRATHIQAGTYAIEEGMTPLSVLARMERGEVIQIELVIPEGWTFHQMRAAVASDADLQQTVAALDDAALMHRLGAAESSPEACFPGHLSFCARHARYRDLSARLPVDGQASARRLGAARPGPAARLSLSGADHGFDRRKRNGDAPRTGR